MADGSGTGRGGDFTLLFKELAHFGTFWPTHLTHFSRGTAARAEHRGSEPVLAAPLGKRVGHRPDVRAVAQPKTRVAARPRLAHPAEREAARLQHARQGLLGAG